MLPRIPALNIELIEECNKIILKEREARYKLTLDHFNWRNYFPFPLLRPSAPTSIKIAEEFRKIQKEKTARLYKEFLEEKSFDRVIKLINDTERCDNLDYYYLKFAQKLFKWLFVTRDKIWRKRLKSMPLNFLEIAKFLEINEMEMHKFLESLGINEDEFNKLAAV
jgi:hypothetical protein